MSEAKALSSLRDIPPVAGKILWARQMERQLRLLSMRLSDVLGEGWENHVDGRPLKAVCDELLRNLDTQRYGMTMQSSVRNFLVCNNNITDGNNKPPCMYYIPLRLKCKDSVCRTFRSLAPRIRPLRTFTTVII